MFKLNFSYIIEFGNYIILVLFITLLFNLKFLQKSPCSFNNLFLSFSILKYSSRQLSES